MGEPSLYERLGSVYAISAVVDSFSDQLVERHNRGSELEYQGLEREQGRISATRSQVPADTVALCDHAGGPFEYTGLPLDEAHSDLQLVV